MNSILMAAGALSATCASLNLSLMWVEFSLATERLQAISNNLKLTRTALLGLIPAEAACLDYILDA